MDPSRLTELFATHAAPLALYARQFDSSDAEELVQEAFVRLLRLSAEPVAIRPWLLQTVRRLAIDRQRSWFRRRRRERAADRVPWFESSADDAIDAAHAMDLLQGLPARQREVLVLRIWNDLTLAQIADLVGTSPPTVHADLTTALATLRTRMERTPCSMKPTKTRS